MGKQFVLKGGRCSYLSSIWEAAGSFIKMSIRAFLVQDV